MIALLKESDRDLLTKELAKMVSPVRLVYFGQALGCEYCPMTREILEEVAGLSDKISLEVHNFAIDRDQVEKYGIARIPAVAIVRVETTKRDGVVDRIDRDYGVRFYGMPAGYEFMSLVSDILDVSAGESGLSPQNRQALANLEKPLHLQVFVTPTCPHFPRAVRLAHKMAIESDLVTADMIEASEFAELSTMYQVYSVPLTVVNKTRRIEGGMPEQMFIPQILQAAGDMEETSSP